jgi:hypothetical protein
LLRRRRIATGAGLRWPRGCSPAARLRAASWRELPPILAMRG